MSLKRKLMGSLEKPGASKLKIFSSPRSSPIKESPLEIPSTASYKIFLNSPQYSSHMSPTKSPKRSPHKFPTKRTVHVHTTTKKTKAGITLPQLETKPEVDMSFELETSLINIESLPLFPQDSIPINDHDLKKMKQSIEVVGKARDISTSELDDTIENVSDTYKNTKIPPPIISKRELLTRTEKFIPQLKLAISNMDFTSKYFTQAKTLQEKSPRRTLNLQERLEIDWDEFAAGYIGSKRQLIIATIIASRCAKELERAERKYGVVSYWTIDGFLNHVLANEIAIRFAMEDMKYDEDSAAEMISATVNYGHLVADHIDLVEDLKPGEILGEESKQFLREFRKDEFQLPTKSSKPTILDDLLSSSDDSD